MQICILGTYANSCLCLGKKCAIKIEERKKQKKKNDGCFLQEKSERNEELLSKDKRQRFIVGNIDSVYT